MRHAALLALALLACGDEEILHGLDEGQANHVLVALADGGIAGRKAREDGTDGGWTVAVAAAEAGRARQILSERELPRPRAAGFADVFGKGSMVPTATEERALYHHALAGELSRSVEAIDGVVEARVHLALPAPDPLRQEPQRPPRAAVLVKCRPEARARIDSLAPGIRSLVSGAAEGLDPAAVSVVVADATAGASPPPRTRPRRPAAVLLALAAAAAASGVALAATALWRGRPRKPGA